MQENDLDVTTATPQDEELSQVPDEPQTSVPRSYEDEIKEIHDTIAHYRGKLKQSQQTIRRYLLGIVLLLCALILVIYWVTPHWVEGWTSSPYGPYSWIPFVTIVGGLVAFVTFMTLVASMILEQSLVTEWKSEIERWQGREGLAKQFAEAQEKPTYFDVLVRMNAENLKEYYRVTKSQTEQSFRLVVVMCTFGFCLLAVGLIVGFIDYAQFSVLSFLTSGSGVVVEFISSIFFGLYNRTLQQMKTYHNDLSSKESMLLSFKLLEDVKDIQEKSRLIEQVLPHFFSVQNSSIDK